MEICVKKKGLRALMVAPWAQLWGYSLAMEYTPSFAEDADLRENLPGGVRFESSGSQPEMIFFFFLPSMRHFQLSHLGRWGTRDAARHCMSRRTVRQMTKDQMRFWWAPW